MRRDFLVGARGKVHAKEERSNAWTPKDIERQIYKMTTSRYDEIGARIPNSSRP